MPRYGLGTAPIGGLFEEVHTEVAVETVRAAYAEGLRLFDTAPLYGFGLAEQRLGQALRGLDRESYRLCTKVGRLLEPRGASAAPLRPGAASFRGTPPLMPVFDFSADAVRRSLEESRDRLGVDRIDIVHIHDPDEHYGAALNEAYPVLECMRSEGSIGAIGVGMNQTAMLARFAREVDLDFLLVAGRYTLLDQSALDVLLPTCFERQVAVIVGGVFNSGVLADPRPGATYNYQPADERTRARAARIGSVCESHGVPLRAAALQFPLAHDAVVTVLVGARSPEEVLDAAHMITHPIPFSLWAELKSEGLLRSDAPVPASSVA